MTRAELSQHLGIDRLRLSAVVSRMAKPTQDLPKRLHITGYVTDMEGQRRYPRAVYALGNYPDARRPKQDRMANKRRYVAKRKALNTTNFVFNLGLPRRAYENRRTG